MDGYFAGFAEPVEVGGELDVDVDGVERTIGPAREGDGEGDEVV